MATVTKTNQTVEIDFSKLQGLSTRDMALELGKQGFDVFPFRWDGGRYKPHDRHPIKPPEAQATRKPGEIDRFFSQGPGLVVAVLLQSGFAICDGKSVTPVPKHQGYDQPQTFAPQDTGSSSSADARDYDGSLHAAAAELTAAKREQYNCENKIRRVRDKLSSKSELQDRRAALVKQDMDAATLAFLEGTPPALDADVELAQIDAELRAFKNVRFDEILDDLEAKRSSAKDRVRKAEEAHKWAAYYWLLKVEGPRLKVDICAAIEPLQTVFESLLAVYGHPFVRRQDFLVMFDDLKRALPPECQPSWMKNGWRKLPGRDEASAALDRYLRGEISK